MTPSPDLRIAFADHGRFYLHTGWAHSIPIIGKIEIRIPGCFEDEIEEVLEDFVETANSRYLGWDVPPGAGREDFILKRIKVSPLICFAWLDGQPLGAAWIDEPSPACCAIHFMICQKKSTDAVYRSGKIFVDTVLNHYQSCISIIPNKFYGAMRLVEACGLERGLVIPGLCNVKSMNKIMDGIIYVGKAKTL